MSTETTEPINIDDTYGPAASDGSSVTDRAKELVATLRRWRFDKYDEGHIAVDETVIITEKPRAGRGTQDHLWHGNDPDTEFWPGKNKDRSKDRAKEGFDTTPGQAAEDAKRGGLGDDAGFAYGITIVKRAHGPYSRRVPLVALGIHIGQATGGSGEATRIALAAAFRNRVLKRRRGARVVADQGFTPRRQFWYLFHELKFKIVQDYKGGKAPNRALPGTAVQDDGQVIPVVGAHIYNGRITCPGYVPEPDDMLDRIDLSMPRTTPEQFHELEDHYRRERLLKAHVAPVKNPLQRVDPHENNDVLTQPLPHSEDELEGSTYSITVLCPAVAGQIVCPLAQTTTKSDIHVLQPPQIGNVDLRPTMCRGEGHATFTLPMAHAKELQDLAHGSEQWEDTFEIVRNQDERFHSQAKSESSGGLDGNLETVGIARNGISAAIQTAVSNANLQHSFALHHAPTGTPSFASRETGRIARYERRRKRDRKKS